MCDDLSEWQRRRSLPESNGGVECCAYVCVYLCVCVKAEAEHQTGQTRKREREKWSGADRMALNERSAGD